MGFALTEVPRLALSALQCKPCYIFEELSPSLESHAQAFICRQEGPSPSQSKVDCHSRQPSGASKSRCSWRRLAL